MDVALLTKNGIAFCEISAEALSNLRDLVIRERGDVCLSITLTNAKGEDERKVWVDPNMILMRLR